MSWQVPMESLKQERENSENKNCPTIACTGSAIKGASLPVTQALQLAKRISFLTIKK